MRLSQHEVESIKKRVYAEDSKAEIYLYGSRVDDEKKGGDIDLLFISQSLEFEAKSRILWGLYEDIGEQKIDIVVAKSKEETPFVEYVFSGAIRL